MAATSRRRSHANESADEIECFEQCAGLSIRGYKKACGYPTKDPSIQLDNKNSSFGNAYPAPQEFIPSMIPRSATSTGCHKSKKKARPQSALPNNQRNHTTTKTAGIPVDFVYDLETRKKLRAAIDEDRRNLLHLNQAREEELRAANLWLFDRRDQECTRSPRQKPKKLSPRTKKERVCWSTPRRDPTATIEETHGDSNTTMGSLNHALDEIVWSVEDVGERPIRSKKMRPKSAMNKRNTVAKNVHFAEWQTTSYHNEPPIPRIKPKIKHS